MKAVLAANFPLIVVPAFSDYCTLHSKPCQTSLTCLLMRMGGFPMTNGPRGRGRSGVVLSAEYICVNITNCLSWNLAPAPRCFTTAITYKCPNGRLLVQKNNCFHSWMTNDHPHQIGSHLPAEEGPGFSRLLHCYCWHPPFFVRYLHLQFAAPLHSLHPSTFIYLSEELGPWGLQSFNSRI